MDATQKAAAQDDIIRDLKEQLEKARAAAQAENVEFKETPRAGEKPFVAGEASPQAAKIDEKVNGIMQKLGTLKMPSYARSIVTIAVVVATAVGVTFVGMTIVDFFVAGAVGLSAGVFLTWIAWAIGLMIAVYLGAKIIFRIGSYFLSGKVDENLASARDGIAHAFTPNPKEKVINPA